MANAVEGIFKRYIYIEILIHWPIAVMYSAGFYNAMETFYVDNQIGVRYHKQLNKLG